MSYAPIRPAREDEIAEVGLLISHSFFDLDANRYLVPPLDDRLPVMADFFAMLTEHADKYCRIDVMDNPEGDGLAGTAVWFDYTTE